MRRWGLQFRVRESNREHHRAEDIFNMSGAIPGKKYRIMKIDGGCRLNSRLCAMGFIPGEVFYVSGASMGGPLCVLIKGTKFAIGRGMAEQIQIREA